MNRANECVFVLWANLFEEAVAAVFITELRKVGLSVKVVGLRHQRAPGVHGLALIPDVTLEDALQRAYEAICVIIPCNESGLKRLESDPRLDDFFQQATINNATLVFGPVSDTAIASSPLFSSSANHIIVHPDREDLLGFARTVAHSLASIL